MKLSLLGGEIFHNKGAGSHSYIINTSHISVCDCSLEIKNVLYNNITIEMYTSDLYIFIPISHF